jgi:hypothetical protein
MRWRRNEEMEKVKPFTTPKSWSIFFIVFFFARKIHIYSMSSQEVQSITKHNKSYIKILGPPNDHYCHQSEPPTR